MAHREKYDVYFKVPLEDGTFRTEGFIALPNRGQDRQIRGSFGPAELQVEVAKARDVPVLWRDFSMGMGVSESWGPGANAYAYNKNADTRHPRLVLPGPYLYTITTTGLTFTGEVKDSIFHEGALRFSAGDKIARIEVGATAAALDTVPAGGLYNKMVVFGGSGSNVAYCTDLLGRYVKYTALNTWTRVADPGGANKPTLRFDTWAKLYWVVGSKQGYQLLAVDSLDPDGGGRPGTYTWHCAGNPDVYSNWTPAGRIGTQGRVRSIAASNRRAYFACDDGLYDLNEQGYSPNITPYMDKQPHIENGQWSTVYAGMVLMSHAFGLDLIPVGSGSRIDAPTHAQPGSGLPNETPVYGSVVTGMNEGGWLAVAQFNGTDSYISYGKPRDMIGVDGPGVFAWHNQIHIPGEKVTHMNIFESHDRWMMVIFSHTAGTPSAVKIRECTLAKAATPLQDWLNGGDYRFAEEFRLYLPFEDWLDPSSRKNLMRFDVQADNLGTKTDSTFDLEPGVDYTGLVSVEIAAKDETESTFDSQGEATASPRSVLYPVGGYKSGYRFGLEIVGRGLTSKGTGNVYVDQGKSDPPILRAIKARAGIVIEQRETRQFRLRVSSGQLRDLTFDRRDPEDMEDFLYKLQNYGPIEVKDEDGDWRVMKVESGATWEEVQHSASGAELTYVELVCSIIEEQEQPPTTTEVTVYTGPTWQDETAPVIVGDVKQPTTETGVHEYAGEPSGTITNDNKNADSPPGPDEIVYQE